jgi:hypothetical protein
MSGVLRKVVSIAAIVAGIALAIPSGGTSLLAVGLGVSSTAAAAIVVGLSLGASLLAPKPKAPKVPESATDRLNASIDPRAPRKIAFGTTALATDIVDQEFSDDETLLRRFIVCASHKVWDIAEIWFDDELAWTELGGVQGKFVGYLTVAITPFGDSSYNTGPRMGDSRKMTGLANVYFIYKLTGNTKKESSPFAQSIPTRLTIKGSGALVYDPRFDSTRGGSGSQRTDDQDTWAFTTSGIDSGENPVIQLLFYLLGWRINGKLAVGKGIPPERIDFDSFITAANLCDEDVEVSAGGTEPRYRSAGVFSEGDSPTTVLDNLKAACNAVLDDVDGKIRIQVLHNDLAAPIASFTDDDVLGAFKWQQTQALDQSFNVLRGSFPNPATLYQMVEYPEVRIDSIDSIDRIETIDFAMVQSVSQAQRLAKQRLQRAQYGGMFSAEFQFTAWRVQRGDVITLTFSPLGWEDKLFRVVETSVRIDGVVPMLLREENEDIYAWDASDAPAVVPADPTTYDPLARPPTPDDADWTLTAVVAQDETPAILVEGISEYPGAQSVAIEHRRVGDIGWTSDGQQEASEPVSLVIGGLEGETDYEARVANRSAAGVSDWLVLDAVTTPANPLLDMLADFSAANNQNSAAIPDPTFATDGSAIFHTINDNGSVDYGTKWSWSGSADDVDGIEGALIGRASASAYTIGSSPDIEDHFRLPPDVLAFGVKGVNPTANFTSYIRYYRRVDPSVWATWAAANSGLAATTISGLIVSAWVKPSRSDENPYKPETSAAYSGTIEGVTTLTIVDGVDRAMNAIRSDYTVSPGGVVTDSVDTDAINNAGYGTLASTVILSASDSYDNLLFGTSFDVEGYLVVKCIIPVRLVVVNPTLNTTYSITFNAQIYPNPSGPAVLGPDVVLEELWNGASATGSFNLAMRNVEFEWRFTGLTAGTYQVGVHAETPSTNGAFLQVDRYVKGEDMRAIK